MDGGRKKWELEKRPLDHAAPAHPADQFTVAATEPGAARPPRPTSSRPSKNEAAAALVDVRSPDEYTRQDLRARRACRSSSIRAGHIPGSKNMPWSKAVNEDGTFKSADELKKLYAEAGIDGKRPIITYCRIGERSSHTWFVLSRDPRLRRRATTTARGPSTATPWACRSRTRPARSGAGK